MQAIPAKYNGNAVSIIGVNLGWATIKDGNEQRKVRVSKLEVENPKALENMKPAPITKVVKAPAKTAKAPAKKAPAKKAAAKRGGDDARLVDPDLSRYSRYDVATPSGSKAMDIGDKAADKLRGKTLAECYDIVADALTKSGDPTSARQLREKYAHLNHGMIRMNLGNRLRTALGLRDKK